MIEIENEKSKDRKYYVGKSHQLDVRLGNHISGNCRSIKEMREGYKVIAIKEIHEIQGLGCSELTDSITSRLENVFVTTKRKEDKDSDYIGGDHVENLECKQYIDELEGYSLKKVTNIEYKVTEDNKHEIVKKIISDISKIS